ncbi:MAG TPA: OsmC family protein [Polyangiales bacterium]|nr:OsmC family protein [Polyangiales bacterium]
MGEYKATIRWQQSEGNFREGTYSRKHTWSFDGGLSLPASSSPQVVKVPYSDPAGVDPEEAFVAAISSCHMLTFIYLAQKRGFEIESYEDDAVGKLSKNEQRVSWVSSVVLSPRILYRGERVPTREELQKLHDDSHHECFIAQSVKTDIRVNILE